MNKRDLALTNLQWLICHKTKPKHIQLVYFMFLLKSNYPYRLIFSP